MRPSILMLGAALAATLLGSTPARACAPAPSHGETVRTDGEDALIVWDEARHLEHFVRRAVFATTATSFGFLVPTPARPALAEAGDTTFSALGEMTRPAVVLRTEWVPEPIGFTMIPLLFFGDHTGFVGAGAPSVTVLEKTRVAGLDAVVLEANDAGALAAWLQAHGFEFRDGLKSWLVPYVAGNWKITAFRYTRPEGQSEAQAALQPVASRAVRMTFTTDVPVYPYREPEDAPQSVGRELHLFVVSPTKLEGRLPDEGNALWGAEVRFSARSTGTRGLAEALAGVDLPPDSWIAEFSDHASKRKASDLVFRPAASPGEVRPPPVVLTHEETFPLPYELPFVVGGIGWWLRRRKKRAEDSAR